MKFLFRRGFICCGCEKRFSADELKYIYKRTCLCDNCVKNITVLKEKGILKETPLIDFIYSTFEYSGIYRKIFTAFKFYGCTANGHLIGQLLRDFYKDVPYFKDFDFIIPVPLSKKRHNKRGYNQSEILAHYISQSIGIPIETRYLHRIKHTMPQSLLNGVSRSDNVSNAFVADNALSGKRVILFDDIHTTGNTSSACAKAFKNAGVKQIAMIASALAKEHPFPSYYF